MDLGFSFPRTNRLDWKCSLPRKEPHPREMRLIVFLGFAAVYNSRSGPRSWVPRVANGEKKQTEESAKTPVICFLIVLIHSLDYISRWPGAETGCSGDDDLTH